MIVVAICIGATFLKPVRLMHIVVVSSCLVSPDQVVWVIERVPLWAIIGLFTAWTIVGLFVDI